jgi:serine/threonine protein kinase
LPTTPLPLHPIPNGTHEQQKQQQQALPVQKEAAPAASQAPHMDAYAAAVAADKLLFSQGEEVIMFTSGVGMAQVQLEADGYIGGGGYAAVYRVEEKLCSETWAADRAAEAEAAGRRAQGLAAQRRVRALKVARPYELQKAMRGDKLKKTKEQYIQGCWVDMRHEHEMLVKAATCTLIVNCFHWGWVEVRGHGRLPALLLEYCPGGSLEQYMAAHPGGLDYETCRRFLISVCGALCFLNKQGIGHRDIKPANLLLGGPEGREEVKLADLGCAFEFEKGTPCGDSVCTPAYQAPELAKEGGQHDLTIDSWLVGCFGIHLRTGLPPYHHLLRLPKEVQLARRTAAELDNPDSPYSKLKLDPVEKEMLQACLAERDIRLKVHRIMDIYPEYFDPNYDGLD